MVGPNGQNLVFLLSLPRSGSSLATAILQNHSRIFATQEMWFLLSLYDLRTAPKRPYGGASILRQFYNGIVQDRTFEDACRHFALDVYNGLLRGSEADVVVDKSPRYYCILEFLDLLFPRSKRIWLVRNPLAVLASYKQIRLKEKGRFDLSAILAGSEFDIQGADLTAGLFRYRHYFRAPHDCAHTLVYERLVDNPAEETRKLCEFIGLPYETGIEVYGNYRDTAKAALYFSMGVGDPNVARDTAPHRRSVDSWKTVLDKREMELYCRAIGSRIFHELGYSEELAEAEAITGTRYEAEPDAELLALRTRQLTDAAGYRWQPEYRLHAAVAGDESRHFADGEGKPALSRDAELERLRMTVSSLEHRQAAHYAERKRLQAQLDALRSKVNRIKAAVPFGNRLSQLVSAYILTGGKSK
ncbi:protein-tyrosine phosphatase [Paenibacillus sp. 32O-W]|uniref:sulfotransferase family protein n=1 Tax=Paenibacillus sp. 32O-W TaxID=1695218 RepID=UPI000722739E|nr:sulfotransferase [Paenibacillus sp. 32O-W]ALS29703.1 protein-tyrosine phosphatase [Paenibacillus sp. 32O-W]